MTSSGRLKVIVTGPVGSGKTTAIAAVSDIPPVNTDVTPTDEVARRKSRTTVAFDFGVVRLDGDDEVHLYGTPGQDRFDFMWEILQEGALGLVVLIDAASTDPLGDLRHFIEAYRDFVAERAVAVGVTRTDVAPGPGIDAVAATLADLGVHGPVFTVDARRRTDVAKLVEALLYTLEPGLQASAG